MKKFVVIGLLAIALPLVACGSSSKKAAAVTKCSDKGSSTASFDQSVAKQDITNAYTTFFDGKNTDSQAKLNQLENPVLAKGLYDATLGNPQNQSYASQTSATISDITFTDDSHADVTFTLNLSGTPTLKDQKGSACKINGVWKISLTAFCDISALGNPAANDDPACNGSSSSSS